MQRATVSARQTLLGLAAAIRSGFCSQRAKKTLVSAITRSPLLIIASILAMVCYSFARATF
jgi:hypothetical protein